MAFRFGDSFDHYTALASKYNAVIGSIVISAGNGRRGTSSLRTTAFNQYVNKTLDNQATWIIGFGFKPTNLSGANTPIVQLLDGGSIQVDLRVSATGNLIVTRNGTTLGTSATALTLGVYQFIEFKATINSTTGAYEVRLNGTNVLSGSGLNTRTTGNNQAATILLGNIAGQNGLTLDFDDLYACDGSGSFNNDFLGDGKMALLTVIAAGNQNVWTPSAGTAGNSYQLIDEAAPNDDSDYISSATVGDVTTVAVTDLTNTLGNIKAMQIGLYARKDDAGTRTIAAVTRSGGADYVGPNQNVGDSYGYLTSVREVDPATSAAWTISAINAMEIGVKTIA